MDTDNILDTLPAGAMAPLPVDAPAPDADPTGAPAADPDAPDAPEPDPVVDALPAADGVPAAPGDHVIERRSFAREDATLPMPVTVITTRDSLLASKD